MARIASFVLYSWMLWGLCSVPSQAQAPTPLHPQPHRLQIALKMAQEAIARKDSSALAEAYYLYGKAYVFAGNYRASQGYFLKSLQLLEPRGDSFELSRIYVRLGVNESRLGRFTDALRYANLSMGIAQRIRSPAALIRAYGTLGQIYENMWKGQFQKDREKYNQIVFNYREKERLCRRLKDTLGIAEANLELGTLLTSVNDPRAIPLLEKALYLFTLKNKTGIRVNVLLHLGAAHLTFGRPVAALKLFQEAEALYAQNNIDEYDTILGLEREYVRYFQMTGQWAQAFAHLKKADDLERNQLLLDREGTVVRLNVEYETAKKEVRLKAQQREIALDTETLRTQQRLTVAVSALFVLAFGMSLVFFRLYRKNQRISRQNEELVKEQNHRVKNNLQVVSSLLSLQSKRLTDEAAKKAIEESRLRVESMAILHRRLYDGDKLARVNVDEFIQELVGVVLQSYGCTTVQTQFAINSIHLSADKAVPLGLIINELTTNACKYAFLFTEHPCYLIRCSRHKQTIELDVTDNGPGLDGPGLDGPGLDGPGLEGPGLEGPGLDGPGLDGTGWTDTQPDHTGELETGWPGMTGNGQATMRRKTFGRQLIQTQVEQLYGTGQYTSPPENQSTGTTFRLTFTV